MSSDFWLRTIFVSEQPASDLAPSEAVAHSFSTRTSAAGRSKSPDRILEPADGTSPWGSTSGHPQESVDGWAMPKPDAKDAFGGWLDSAHLRRREHPSPWNPISQRADARRADVWWGGGSSWGAFSVGKTGRMGTADRSVVSVRSRARTQQAPASLVPKAYKSWPASRVPTRRAGLNCAETGACADSLATLLAPAGWRLRPPQDSYLVDSASSHMLVSKIKPCMSKYKQTYCETANGSLNQLSFI
jgi:hypothetical protein